MGDLDLTGAIYDAGWSWNIRVERELEFTVQTKLVLMLLSTFLAFLCSEGLVRIIRPQNLSGPWLILTDTGLLVNKSTGTAVHQYGERIVHYSFFEPHLRDTPIEAKSLRILVVGDSYTFGWLLNKEDTSVNHLQQYTNSEFGTATFQYLNAAAGGWGAADYLAFVEDFGTIINPEIILVFVNTDDIERSIQKRIYTLSIGNGLNLTRHTLESSLLGKYGNSLPAYQWLLEHSHLAQLIRQSLLTSVHRKNNDPTNTTGNTESNHPISHPEPGDLRVSREDATTLGKAIFYRLKSWCDENGVLLLVTTTGWHSPDTAEELTDPTATFLEHAPEIFENMNVPFVDTTTYVSEARNRNPAKFVIPGDLHPNESGSRLIADKAWQYFIRRQLADYVAIARERK